jgi:hypothetical protein
MGDNGTSIETPALADAFDDIEAEIQNCIKNVRQRLFGHWTHDAVEKELDSRALDAARLDAHDAGKPDPKSLDELSDEEQIAARAYAAEWWLKELLTGQW